MEGQADVTGVLAGIEQLIGVGASILGVMLLGFLFASWLTRLQARLRDRRGRAERVVAWLPVVQVLVWLVAVVIAAYIAFGAPPVVIVAVLVPALTALVVASRDLVRNGLAGIVLAFEHSILAGDLITISAESGEVRGQVVAIGLRRTLLRRSDGSDILIPNATLLNATVRTNRAHEQDSAVEIELNLDEALTTTDFQRISKLASEAASVSRFASPHRRPEVHLEPTDEGRYRVTVQAYAFAPEYVRHLRTDVVSLFTANLGEARPDEALSRPSEPLD